MNTIAICIEDLFGPGFNEDISKSLAGLFTIILSLSGSDLSVTTAPEGDLLFGYSKVKTYKILVDESYTPGEVFKTGYILALALALEHDFDEFMRFLFENPKRRELYVISDDHLDEIPEDFDDGSKYIVIYKRVDSSIKGKLMKYQREGIIRAYGLPPYLSDLIERNILLLRLG